ncbi:GTP binding protein [Histoplasma capsulatum H143]|uniref:GTP binding protein n=1 Tax=Ajellomyces capsulatus (strain H143) TaxID=544712 RepID=C6HJI2_AJECH|nr:GTP binding protein [Histoplasma capsulatum H143]
MASVFTYDPDPPRVSSPWSTPGCTTPRRVPSGNRGAPCQEEPLLTFDPDDPNFLADNGITKLDAEPQDGPTEYKLHLLLRSRRSFLSLSTGNLTSGSSHSKPSPVGPESPPVSSEPVTRPAQALSSQSREHRLQQLTTQLLWRLQQSSPFHSSSTLGLVLPVLPEATPTLGVPSKPARLLPGLEESQGALYEIGVSDDGTFVGLAEDELEESLTNLKAMAASLGCTVEVLRKVAVGHCEWNENADDDSKPVVLRSGKLWVAEALVSPDFKQSDQLSPGDEKRGSLDSKVRVAPPASTEDEAIFSTPQLHIAMAGPSAAGKSSLLGSLSTSALDNGRGKSRLSLLKHRHEIASGITSSVAQELIGYSPANTKGAEPTPDVVNYASGNVTAWNDIHASAQGGRLVFLSDLPGSTRYLKSTLRGLVGWEPHYVLLCIPANSPLDSSKLDVPSELDLSLSYLDLCMKLDLPVIIVVTKLDIATRIGKLHALLRTLPIPARSSTRPIPISGKKTAQKTAQHEAVKLFDITEVFEVPALKVYSVAGDNKRQHDRAIILCGRVRRGNISIGDQLVVGPLLMNSRTDIDSSHLVPRSKPLVSRSLPEELATFYLQNGHAGNEHSQTQQARWQVVRVVSLRNLRLPVTTILEHQIGTIGVDSVKTTSCLGSIRKGMVLADFHPISSRLSIPSPLLAPVFHTGFVAIFPALNFTSTLSSSLIMGGNAIVYIASIRAAAKVTCVEANRNSQRQFLTGNEEIFSLDAGTFPVDKAAHPTSLKPVANNGPEMFNGFNESGDVSITFSFVSTVEWIELNSRVLAMPGTAMVTTSSSVPAAPGSLALKGFVGRVCKVLSD